METCAQVKDIEWMPVWVCMVQRASDALARECSVHLPATDEFAPVKEGTGLLADAMARVRSDTQIGDIATAVCPGLKQLLSFGEVEEWLCLMDYDAMARVGQLGSMIVDLSRALEAHETPTSLLFSELVCHMDAVRDVVVDMFRRRVFITTGTCQ